MTAIGRKPTQGLGEIPVAPIRRLIEAWIGRHEYSDFENLGSADSGRIPPLRILSERVWPEVDYESSARAIYRIVNGEQDWITFDLADRIVCDGFDEPELWLTDPELAELYATVDFRNLDAARPTCPAAKLAVARDVRKVHRDCLAISKTSKATGIGYRSVQALLTYEETYRETACA